MPASSSACFTSSSLLTRMNASIRFLRGLYLSLLAPVAPLSYRIPRPPDNEVQQDERDDEKASTLDSPGQPADMEVAARQVNHENQTEADYDNHSAADRHPVLRISVFGRNQETRTEDHKTQNEDHNRECGQP